VSSFAEISVESTKSQNIIAEHHCDMPALADVSPGGVTVGAAIGGADTEGASEGAP
jgi:hypothetical protein